MVVLCELQLKDSLTHCACRVKHHVFDQYKTTRVVDPDWVLYNEDAFSFSKTMPTIRKAGAIVLSEKNPELLILLYRGVEHDWSFPKGHVKNNETAQDAARREVLEETGMPVKLVTMLPALEYDHPNGDHIVVEMSIMQSRDDRALKREHHGDRLAWTDYRETADKLSYDNIKEYYRKNFAAIERTILDLETKNRAEDFGRSQDIYRNE